MRLNNEGLKDRKSWENAGYSLPEYDRKPLQKQPARTLSGFISVPVTSSAHFRPMSFRIC
jgi:hypothetical protein